MKTFTLALATIALVAATSTASFASTFGGGNGNQAVNSATVSLNDSVNAETYASQTVKPATTLSETDALLLRLSTDKDTNRR